MASVPQAKLHTVLNTTVPPEHVKADVAIVCCIEPRLHNRLEHRPLPLIDKFAQEQGWQVYVPLTEIGGVQVLASEDPKDHIRKEALLQRIEKEIEIHHPPVISLTLHTDCGAYGYSKAFGFASNKEEAQLCHDLWLARITVQKRIGDAVPIRQHIIGVNGVAKEVSF